MSIEPGQTIAHYRIVEKIGEGGMGAVYVAEDTRLKRRVALKILPAAMLGDPERLARFQREAEALAALDHPNIVTIHSVEQSGGVPFLTMTLVEGRPLDQVIPRNGLPLATFFSLATSIAQGLATAHEKGITHRDLKPSNIMVTDEGRLQILDFGLAKFRVEGTDEGNDQETVTMTRRGTVVGTAPYMSPEQARGDDVDHRSDIFSLGILLYEMATGERPFSGAKPMDVMSAILRADARPVSDVRAALPRQLGRIIDRCLKKDPKARFQTSRDVANELLELQAEIQSDTAAAPATAGRRPVPRRRIVAAAAVAVLAAAIGVWLGLGRRGPERAAEAPPGPGSRPAGTTIAVLPFRNLGAGDEFDYLTIAVPDEITTVLSRLPSLRVRPFSTAALYGDQPLDIRATGRQMRVERVVTGQFVLGGDALRLTLEAIDVPGDRVLWRESVTAPAANLISLFREVTASIRRGLLPALGASSDGEETALPEDPEAYALYLQALAVPRDPTPNRRAIAMLEQVVEVEPGFAPAWAQLGHRMRYEFAYSQGGEPAKARALEALETAVRLDPAAVDAPGDLIGMQVEQGELRDALRAAEALVARRPDHAYAYFVRSYVRRYGGLLEEAIADCEQARAIDPTSPRWRSCYVSFVLSGDFETAQRYLQLDAGTEWAADASGHALLTVGKPGEANKAWGRRVEEDPWGEVRLLELFVDGADPAELQAAGRFSYEASLRDEDVEMRYFGAATLATCGQHEPALRLLRSAIEGKYCSYPGLDKDRSWDGLRDDPEFLALRERGKACRDEVLRYQESLSSGRGPSPRAAKD